MQNLNNRLNFQSSKLIIFYFNQSDIIHLVIIISNRFYQKNCPSNDCGNGFAIFRELYATSCFFNWHRL